MLFVEQPIGVGYSQGVSNFQVRARSLLLEWRGGDSVQGCMRLQDEEELVEQLVGFMQQFLEVFRELRGKKLYLTGESVSAY